MKLFLSGPESFLPPTQGEGEEVMGGHVVDAGVLWSRLEGVPRKRRSSTMAARRATAHASCKYIVGERQRAVIELAHSTVVAGLFGCWHALYALVIGLSVLTAAFFLASHKASLGIARKNGSWGARRASLRAERLEGWPRARSRLWPSFETCAILRGALPSGRGSLMRPLFLGPQRFCALRRRRPSRDQSSIVWRGYEVPRLRFCSLQKESCSVPRQKKLRGALRHSMQSLGVSSAMHK
jgi:hypothetical protein